MAYSDWSNTDTENAKLSGAWLAQPANPSSYVRFPYGGVGRQHSLDRAKTAMQFVGRAYPVYDVGEARAETIQMSTTIPGDEPNAKAQYELAKKIGRDSNVVLYRDGRGRKLYAMPSDWSAVDIPMKGYEVSFLLNRVDYDEALPGVT